MGDLTALVGAKEGGREGGRHAACNAAAFRLRPIRVPPTNGPSALQPSSDNFESHIQFGKRLELFSRSRNWLALRWWSLVSAQVVRCCVHNKAQKIIRHINVNIPFMFDCWAYPVVLLLQPTKRLQSLNIPFQQKARSTGFEKWPRFLSNRSWSVKPETPFQKSSVDKLRWMQNASLNKIT